DIWTKQGWENGPLGLPVGDILTNTQTGIVFQQYAGGFIVGNEKYGFYESRGKLRSYWAEHGYENGFMGFPMSNIIEADSNIIYQRYQTGTLYYDSSLNQFTWRGE
ncbi:hypothetical protein IKG50_04360, partial [Candidatus Saccharibacteria bacterium]|nr:hypothetical protein [Candidatus Saccharibacteria bacterium]